MKCAVFTALIFLGSMGTTDMIASERKTLVAQSGHVEQPMHGTAQPHGKPTGEMKHEMRMGTATEGIFEGVGEVLIVSQEKSLIVIDHKDIKGYHPTMTMRYPVEPKTLLKGLKPGDRIKFKIDAAKKKIVAIERLTKKK